VRIATAGLCMRVPFPTHLLSPLALSFISFFPYLFLYFTLNFAIYSIIYTPQQRTLLEELAPQAGDPPDTAALKHRLLAVFVGFNERVACLERMVDTMCRAVQALAFAGPSGPGGLSVVGGGGGGGLVRVSGIGGGGGGAYGGPLGSPSSTSLALPPPAVPGSPGVVQEGGTFQQPPALLLSSSTFSDPGGGGGGGAGRGLGVAAAGSSSSSSRLPPSPSQAREQTLQLHQPHMRMDSGGSVISADGEEREEVEAAGERARRRALQKPVTRRGKRMKHNKIKHSGLHHTMVL
jgi:hypothetical protein